MSFARINMTCDGACVRTGVVHQPEAVAAALIYALPTLGTAIVPGVAALAGFTYASVLSYTILAAGSLGLSYAANRLAGQAAVGQSAQSPQKSQINIKQALPERFRSYGIVKIGGPIAFERIDSGGQGTDANLAGACYIVLLQGQGPIDSVREHWLDDRQTVIDGAGVPTAHLGAGAFPLVNIINKLGTASQTAFSQLTSAFPQIYTSDHRWRGVPVTLVKFITYVVSPNKTTEIALATYPQGPWKYRAVQRAALLYDPREVTHDADGDPDDPSSANWTWSDNAALVILDFLRHPDGWARRTGRAMLPIAQFHLPDWIAFADLCDDDVDLKIAGTVKRYRICGSYQMTLAPKQVLQGMIDACDAELYRHSNGKIGIRGGAWTAPTVTIGDADIIEHTLNSHKGKASACNIIKAKYVSPPHDYQEVDMDPLHDEANLTLRGEELTADLDFAWVPSHSQARRLAKIQMGKRNPDWFGTIVTGPRGLLAYNQRVITVEISELGINDSFLVTGFRPSAGFERIEIDIASLDAAAYDFDADDDEGDPPAFTALTDDTSAGVPAPQGLSLSLDVDGRVTITWSVTNPSGFTLNYEAQYHQTAPTSGDPIQMRVSEAALVARTDPLVNGHTYELKVRSISPGGQPSQWTSAVAVGGDLTAGGNDSFTKILLHMEGSNGGTTFTDSNAGGSAHTWTASGATTSTAHPMFGTSSMLGAPGRITTPDHADFTLGSLNWTIDFKINRNGHNGAMALCGQLDATGNATLSSVGLAFTAGNKIEALIATAAGYINGGTGIQSVSTITDSNDHHIALVRDSATIKLFIDGVLDQTAAISGAITDSAALWAVGRLGAYTGFADFQGYMKEVRLTVGVARWTANFTPPTAAYS